MCVKISGFWIANTIILSIERLYWYDMQVETTVNQMSLKRLNIILAHIMNS